MMIPAAFGAGTLTCKFLESRSMTVENLFYLFISPSGLAEKLETSPGLDGKIRKESIMNNATKICLKFQLSNPPSTSGKYLLTDRLGGKEAWRPTHFS